MSKGNFLWSLHIVFSKYHPENIKIRFSHLLIIECLKKKLTLKINYYKYYFYSCHLIL